VARVGGVAEGLEQAGVAVDAAAVLGRARPRARQDTGQVLRLTGLGRDRDQALTIRCDLLRIGTRVDDDGLVGLEEVPVVAGRAAEAYASSPATSSGTTRRITPGLSSSDRSVSCNSRR
jgi:hypothetical protein